MGNALAAARRMAYTGVISCPFVLTLDHRAQVSPGGNMDAKRFLIGFVVTFVVGFLVTALVTYVWNLIFHGAGVVDWETAFTLALVAGIAVPVANAFAGKKL